MNFLPWLGSTVVKFWAGKWTDISGPGAPQKVLFASNTCPASQNHLTASCSVAPAFTLLFIFWFSFHCDLFTFFLEHMFCRLFSFLWDRVLEMGRVRFPSWDDLLAVSRQHLGFPKVVSSSVWPLTALSSVLCLVWSHREEWSPLWAIGPKWGPSNTTSVSKPTHPPLWFQF